MEDTRTVDSMIITYISTITFGDIQVSNNMAVIPLFTAENTTVDYMTLKEALDQQALLITEVNKGGSVPQLKATNTSKRSVLMLDGEQLVGAKQNRILNTTILLQGESEIIIPVRCTEQGRWSYTSDSFADAGNLTAHHMRVSNLQFTAQSVKRGQRAYADDNFVSQAKVWSQIEGIQHRSGVKSATSALQDVYRTKKEEMDTYVQAFDYVPQQKGLLVFINGEVVGFDLLSRDAAYKTLHPKLVLSYTMDALLQQAEPQKKPDVKKVEAFFQELHSSKEKRIPSLAQGVDYRFEGERITGSALVFGETIVHLAFFRVNERENREPMSSFQQRRNFRQRPREE